jgi:hypothetical protein
VGACTVADDRKEGIEVMTGVLIPKESIGKVDLLLGQATMLTADRWDEMTGMVQEAMGIVLLMAATHPSRRPVDVPRLASMNAMDCVEQALREVQSWDLSLAAAFPDLARLRVLLTDVRTDPNVPAADRG